MLIVRYQGEVGTPVAGGLRERGEKRGRDERRGGEKGEKERKGGRGQKVERRRKETSKDWKHEVIMLKFYTCIE